MKKRIIALLLSLMMVCSLCACGSSDEDVSGTVTPVDKPADTQEVSEEKDFSIGETNGNVYENEFLGIGCALDGDWQFYTQEQIMEMNDYVIEEADSEDISKALKNNAVIYDMMATDQSNGNTIQVNFENLGPVNSVLYGEEKYCEAGLDNITKSYGDMGYENVSAEIITVTFAGEEHQAIVISSTLQGIQIYQKEVVIKCGNYMALVCFSSANEASVDEMMSLFYKL